MFRKMRRSTHALTQEEIIEVLKKGDKGSPFCAGR